MKTESNLRPSARYEIEAPARIEGRTCSVIFYENITGPFEKESEPGRAEQFYSYDRFSIDVPYRDNLNEAIESDYESWLNTAKAAEEKEEELPDKEKIKALEMEIKALKAEKAEQDEIIDTLIISSLGGDENV